jgi:DNA-binding NarL/FixJ family response regulator
MNCKILLADEQRLFRAGIAALITRESSCAVVAESGDGCDVIDLCVARRPDVVVLDVHLQGMNGIDVVAELSRRCRDTRALMLTDVRSEAAVLAAMDAGAGGYLLKSAPPPELFAALAAVRNGHTYLSPQAASCLIHARRRGQSAEAGPLSGLTPRQRQVLQLIAEGKRNSEIADRLRISAKTVESHRRNLMLRLDRRDVPGLVRLAIESGLLKLSD